MHTQPSSYLTRTYQLLFALIGATAVLYYGRSLLIPLAFALVLSLLLLPLNRCLERVGIPRALAAVLGILLLVGFFVLIFYLLSWQLGNVLHDKGQIREKVHGLINQLRDTLSQHLGLPKTEQKRMMSEGNTRLLISLTGIINNLLGIVVDIILVLVYIFLLLEFRSHLLSALLKAVPLQHRENVHRLVREAGNVAQQYLAGLALMIVCLWVMYSIGFSLVGVHYAVFFALLCGTLELIPFFGNITGTLLTVCMGLVQGGDLGMIAGILITYGSIQFIQSYILQPMVVGREVNLNPLFTILCIVIGNAIWGIPGMVLAVPLFGILKIICDHFEPLKPYGYLLGGTPKKKKVIGWLDRLRRSAKN